ncbi:MAG: glycan-binding surface protein [Prevotellaceae bacterium]|jgi:hypothetical protein|nr:glycan-binding surface protein [Prevotellaceae bacterium]
MKKKNLAYVALFAFGVLTAGCGGGAGKSNGGAPEITKMKSEFVPDGQEAVIYGKNLVGADVMFPGVELPAEVNKEKSSDTTLVVTVPAGSKNGKISVKTAQGQVESSFFFRDDRNFIINFDDRLATWGGYNPFDEEGNRITSIAGDSLPAPLPEPCSGKYGFLYGEYNAPWTMKEAMFIQYVANPSEGGHGAFSVAGPYVDYPIENLVLKFEVYIPKKVPYQDIRTEIFCGPYDSPDKHGRDVSPICFWEPYKATGSFYTDGWETITIPMTEFTHGISSDEEVKKIVDLKTATNFSFVQFGAPVNVPFVYMCLDNFRIVPITE